MKLWNHFILHFFSILADRAWWEWIRFWTILGLFSRHVTNLCNVQLARLFFPFLFPSTLNQQSVLHFSLPLWSPTALNLLSHRVWGWFFVVVVLFFFFFFFLGTHFWPPTTGGEVATQRAVEIKPKSLSARAIFLRHGQVCPSGLWGLMGPHSILHSQKWQPVPLTSC